MDVEGGAHLGKLLMNVREKLELSPDPGKSRLKRMLLFSWDDPQGEFQSHA
jgi:hypothetical protein